METVFEYTLKTPVSVGERTVTELKFHRPKVRDFLRTDGHDLDTVGADQALCSALSGEPEIIIQEIDADDWAIIRVELGKIWLRFFGVKEKSDPNQTAEAEKAGKPFGKKDTLVLGNNISIFACHGKA